MNTCKVHIRSTLLITTLVSLCTLTSGCGQEAEDGPPKIMLGESSCAECGMIISDERFATVTVIDGSRGVEPILFDDFNCQINFEHKYPETQIVTRWAHDYQQGKWMATGQGWFVRSNEIRSPMASHMACFSNRDEAEVFSKSVSGIVIEFQAAWSE